MEKNPGAQSGVITKEIDDACAKVGLLYPPDPGSMKISTIGGNVAGTPEASAASKYGVTRDYVMGIEVNCCRMAATFSAIKCGRMAGYSMKDLFVGSGARWASPGFASVLPRPKARKTMLALYDSMEKAAETISAIIAAKIIPCTLSS